MDPAREQDGRSQPDGRGAVIDCTAEANHPNNNGHSTPAATGLALALALVLVLTLTAWPTTAYRRGWLCSMQPQTRNTERETGVS